LSGANLILRNAAKWPLLRMRSEQRKKTRGVRAFFVVSAVRRNYAACLCMAPDEDTVPRIALIERSIAAHRRPISAAARPSA
jgi:hypothetical protein